MSTLRQRIRKGGINCTPWSAYKHEIQNFPVSSKCLFKKDGLSVDVLEMELKSEGWLTQDETLMDVLLDVNNLKRKLDYSDDEDLNDEPFDDTWTLEDYEYFYNRRE
jgi:hypothetical protein